MLPKPCLIIVNGHPASGKTTLAKKLARDLQFPVFHRDEFKENLFDQIGWEDNALKQKLAITSYKLLYKILEQFAVSNQSLIIESNFTDKLDSPLFQKILSKSNFRVVQIHCSAKPKTLFERFQARTKKDRHAGHQDHLRLEEFKARFQTPHHPLQISDSLTINVETSNFKKSNYLQLLKQLKFQIYFALVERAYYEAGAFGMIFNKKGEILLCHRTDKNTWNLPGGVIDPNESPWAATIREVREETGLKVRLKHLTGVYFKKRAKQGGQEALVFNFLCEKVSGKIRTTNEAQEIKYFPTDKLPKNLSSNQRQRILDYLKHPQKTTYKTQGVII